MKRISKPVPPPTLPFAIKPVDPGALFSEFEQLLVSNSGEDAFDIAIKLIASKIEDELSARAARVPRRFMTAAGPPEARSDMEALLRAASERWPGIIEFNGGLGITAEQLVRCTRPLCGWDILDSSFHHLDALLESLVSRGAKGALGLYFTPRSVVRMCVHILNPTGGERVIDPACGSGGFLFEAVDHAMAGGGGTPQCLGIDFGARSLKVASLMAVAVGDQRIHVSRANSIDGRDFVDREAPAEWAGFLKKPEPNSRKGRTGRPWGVWHDLRCDVLLTNPPFAGTVDESAIISAYDSQQSEGAGRKGAVGREHLFLERAVDLLDPGGRMAIVLPQGLLANASAAYLRRWATDRCRVLGVIGLHPHTFLPNTGVKTSILFLSREPASDDYPVFFGVSREPGKDSAGRPSGPEDLTLLASQMSAFLHDAGYRWASHTKKGSKASAWRECLVSSQRVLREGRLDAEFYESTIRHLQERMEELATSTIASQVARSVPRFKRDLVEEIDYVDISAVDSKTGVPLPNRMASEEAPSRASALVRPGDILVSTVRPDRNAVGLVRSESDRPQVASNGFCILRPEGVAPELLFTYCKSDAFKRLLARHATATMYPAVTDSDVLGLPLVLPVGEQAEQITTAVRSAFKKLDEARREMATAISMMNDFLPNGKVVDTTDS